MSPVAVAALRSILLAAAMAAATAAVDAASTADFGELTWAAPLLVAVLRIIEGAIDKARGQAPQTSIGGSHDAIAARAHPAG